MEPVTMGPLDRRIVHGLMVAPRASFRDLATAIGMSDQTVARRYRALIAEAGLRITARVAEAALGWDSWLIRLRTTPDAAVPLAEALASRHDTSWVRLASGGTEVSCGLQTRGVADRSTMLLERLSGGRQMVDMSAHLLLHNFSPIAWSWLSGALNAEEVASLADLAPPAPAEPSGAQVTWNADDETLVSLLQADGRASAASLADATGWHESTVRRRIQQLTASGALDFDVDLDESALGIQVVAQMWLTVDPGSLDAVGQEVARHPEVPFVAAFTGPANLFVSVASRDAGHLYRYLTDRLGQIRAIRSIETVPVIRTYKRSAVVRGDRFRSV